MITENNTIKTEFSDFKRVQKALFQKLFVCSVVALIIGAIGVLAYIILATVWETLYEYTPAWCDALLVFAVPLGIGIVFTLSFRSTFKQAEKLAGSVNEYEFYSDCVIIREINNGKEVAGRRTEYNRINTTQKGQYLLIRYLNNNQALPIDTATLSERELNTIKKLLRLDVPEGAETIQLADAKDLQISVDLSQPRA